MIDKYIAYSFTKTLLSTSCTSPTDKSTMIKKKIKVCYMFEEKCEIILNEIKYIASIT